MEKYKVEVTEPAENDLIQIRNYINDILVNTTASDNLITKIKEQILSLQLMPSRHQVVNNYELAQKGIRFITVEKHIIFYTVNEKEKTVFIVRILYGKREWCNLL